MRYSISLDASESLSRGPRDTSFQCVTLRNVWRHTKCFGSERDGILGLGAVICIAHHYKRATSLSVSVIKSNGARVNRPSSSTKKGWSEMANGTLGIIKGLHGIEELHVVVPRARILADSPERCDV